VADPYRFRLVTKPARKRLPPLVAAVLATFLIDGPVSAQAPSTAAAPLLPSARTAAGTAWQPDLAPMDALHRSLGAWRLMLHGAATVGYVRERLPKGGDLVGSTNWLMATAARRLGTGELTVSAMGSAETLTLGDCGAPRLLGTSGVCDTDGFRDFQHPHPPIMELAAHYTERVREGIGLELFAALAGQPALGPPGYAHRASAAADPIAPLSEHELDPAHVSAGVLTAGVFGTRWKIEGSVFDGEAVDPDELLVMPGALRSVAARASYNPTPAWSLQASLARIVAGTGHHAGAGGMLRTGTASASHVRPIAANGSAAFTAAWAYMEDGILPRHSLLLESSITAGARHAFFGRAEIADRAEARVTIIEHPDGTHEHLIDANRLRVAQLSAGYRISHVVGGAALGLGIRGGMSFLPAPLGPVYHARRPLGFAVYASLRPAHPAAPHIHSLELH
jgi:hypothetical protein